MCLGVNVPSETESVVRFPKNPLVVPWDERFGQASHFLAIFPGYVGTVLGTLFCLSLFIWCPSKAADIPKAKREITWWSTNDLPLVAKLKLVFASHPNTQSLAEQSRSLQPLMWELLHLLNTSYSLQEAKHIEISKDLSERDLVVDRLWFTNSGGFFTANKVIGILEKHVMTVSWSQFIYYLYHLRWVSDVSICDLSPTTPLQVMVKINSYASQDQRLLS